MADLQRAMERQHAEEEAERARVRDENQRLRGALLLTSGPNNGHSYSHHDTNSVHQAHPRPRHRRSRSCPSLATFAGTRVRARSRRSSASVNLPALLLHFAAAAAADSNAQDGTKPDDGGTGVDTHTVPDVGKPKRETRERTAAAERDGVTGDFASQVSVLVLSKAIMSV